MKPTIPTPPPPPFPLWFLWPLFVGAAFVLQVSLLIGHFTVQPTMPLISAPETGGGGPGWGAGPGIAAVVIFFGFVSAVGVVGALGVLTVTGLGLYRHAAHRYAGWPLVIRSAATVVLLTVLPSLLNVTLLAICDAFHLTRLSLLWRTAIVLIPQGGLFLAFLASRLIWVPGAGNAEQVELKGKNDQPAE